MDHQYSIINKCSHLLKQSEMATIDKLRVELQLFHMKRLLLDDAIPSETKYDFCGEDVFDALHSQMRRICGGDCGDDSLSELIDSIGGMLTALGGAQRT